MFTGIIEELGKVRFIKKGQGIYTLSVTGKKISKSTDTGDSIAVNGVCLTAVKIKEEEIIFEVMDETMKRTTLSGFRKNDIVNLESSLKMGDKIGGHMVSGHIDGVGTIKSIIKKNKVGQVKIEFPAKYGRFVVPKGSVAIDGTSLTVVEVGSNWLSVHLIPHTLETNTLGALRVGAKVNFEVDSMAKYADKSTAPGRGITGEFLREKGFA